MARLTISAMVFTSEPILSLSCKNSLKGPDIILSYFCTKGAMTSFCDIMIRCNHVTFSAHQCVLSASGEYFENILTQQTMGSLLDLPISSDVMPLLLDYIYEGILELTPDNLMQVLSAADSLQLNDLFENNIEDIIKYLTLTNFIQIWKYAEKYKLSELEKAVVEYCDKNVGLLIENEGIAPCSPKQMYSYLKLSSISVPTILHLFLIWFQHDAEAKDKHIETIFEYTTFREIHEQKFKLILNKKPFSDHPEIVNRFVIAHKQARVYQTVDATPDFEEKEIKSETQTDSPSPSKAKSSQISINVPKLPLMPKRNTLNSSNRYSDSSVPSKSSLPLSLLPMSSSSPSMSANNIYVEEIQFSTSTPDKINSAENSISKSPPPVPLRSLSLPSMQNKIPHLMVFVVKKNNSLAINKLNLNNKSWLTPEQIELPFNYKILPLITTFNQRIFLLGGRLNEFLSSTYNTCVSKFHLEKSTSMLLPRVHFGVAASNFKLYVIGGRNSTGWLRDVECYDPIHDVWHQMAPLNEAKSAPSVTALHEHIYAVGGLKGNKDFSRTIERYHPEADQWTCLKPLSTGRYRMAIGAISKHIYILGGSKETQLETKDDNFLSYNVELSTWQNISGPETFQDDQPCAVAWNKKLWVISRRNLNLYNYDPSSNTWQKFETNTEIKGGQYIKTMLIVKL